MRQTEEIGMDQKNLASIVLVGRWGEYDVFTPSILIDSIGEAKEDKQNSGSTTETMIHDTRPGSNGFYNEGWGKRVLFPNQLHLVPAMREEVIKMNCMRPSSRTRLTMVESSWSYRSS